MDEQSPKGVTSCLGNVTGTRECEQMGERGVEIPSYTEGWRLGNVHQRISPVVVVVSAQVWAKHCSTVCPACPA